MKSPAVWFVLLPVILAYPVHTPASGAITGRVISTTASPVAGAAVSLRVSGASAVTGADGKFSIDVSTGISSGGSLKQSRGSMPLRLDRRGLSFPLATEQKVRISLFDIRGRAKGTVTDQFYGPGTHTIAASAFVKAGSTAGYYVAEVYLGSERYVIGYTSTGKQNPLIGAGGACGATVKSTVSTGAASGAITTVDALVVTKSSYAPRSLEITNYSAQDVGDIVVATVAEDSASIERKVDSLLALMSNQEKAGQMVQAMNSTVTPAEVTANGFGSIFNGGEEPVKPNTPQNWATRLDALQDGALASAHGIPMIYGLDAVHGNGKVVGSTIFPHNIGLGCTFDTIIVEQAGRITAVECAAVGVHLTFAPCVAAVRDERWGRTYEGFGETPEINSQMGAAFTRGLQGNGDLSNPAAIAACVKHYLGDGGTAKGVTGAVTELSEATMRAVHFPPYAACAREKMASVMPSYSAWKRDGQSIRQSLDSAAMNRMLKRDLAWDGFVLSDYDAIPQALATGYGTQSAGTVITAGLDMAMISTKANSILWIKSIQEALAGGLLTQARIDDAVRRILRIKFRMNLWGHPKSQASLLARVGCTQHRAIAREAVRKSLVLLKNESAALPLKRTDRVAVVGPWANSMGAQCGGWTIGWQGLFTYTVANVGGGQTIMEGLKQVGGANVAWDAQGDNLADVDKIVLVLGEHPYAEGKGDSANPALSRLPYAALLEKCAASGKPVVCVLVSGRPMLITDKLDQCKAFVAAWLPGTEGGGVADVLYGDYNFSGKLTHTWPRTLDQIPINAGPVYADEPKGSGGDPLFAYGFGLKY
jgi:beta-glucosidase